MRGSSLLGPGSWWSIFRPDNPRSGRMPGIQPKPRERTRDSLSRQRRPQKLVGRIFIRSGGFAGRAQKGEPQQVNSAVEGAWRGQYMVGARQSVHIRSGTKRRRAHRGRCAARWIGHAVEHTGKQKNPDMESGASGDRPRSSLRGAKRCRDFLGSRPRTFYDIARTTQAFNSSSILLQSLGSPIAHPAVCIASLAIVTAYVLPFIAVFRQINYVIGDWVVP